MADIRWKQRLANFDKSLELLKEGLLKQEPDIFHKAGVIQFFEMSLELGWKTMKDYLEEEGHKEIDAPRSVVKKAFETHLISNGTSWLEALKDRNLTSHTYDEETADEVMEKIKRDYLTMLTDLSLSLHENQ